MSHGGNWTNWRGELELDSRILPAYQRRVSHRLGGFHSARLALYSLVFEEIELAQHVARWDDATDISTKADT